MPTGRSIREIGDFLDELAATLDDLQQVLDDVDGEFTLTNGKSESDLAA